MSGGEKQRIVLARAILKDAPIIVLDEATAFQDPENEQLIQQSLSHLIQGKTTVMIAHRLNTVLHADQILVMKDGRIVECGTHKALLERQGIYNQMWISWQKIRSWKLERRRKETDA